MEQEITIAHLANFRELNEATLSHLELLWFGQGRSLAIATD
jgi:hypothetical protein